MKKILVIMAAALSLLAFGCKSIGSSSKGSGKAITPSALCGEWKVQSMTGFANAAQMEATLSIMAKDEDEYSLTGFSGVNSYFATLSDSPKAFPIGNNMASTKMMGASAEMAFEDEYLKILCNAPSWKIEGSKLTITSGKSSVILTK